LHPDDEFARAHLDSRFGKTEAWIILEADPGAAVLVGFREPTDQGTIAGWVDSQDSEALLSALNPVEVRAGDTLYVPAGTPHAIGEGILLAELQQPTDLSVLLEWKGFAPDAEAGFLGLGRDLALQALDLGPWTNDDLTRARSCRGTKSDGVETLFPSDADAFFRAERVRSGAHLEQGFAVLLVIDGEGELRGDRWRLELGSGNAVLVPHAAGPHSIEGTVEALRCMPPALDPTS
jgi:mannose-6-phosphate isomerase